MKVMILAAGRGQRMLHLTENQPKPLVKVAGIPLIEWHIRRLVAQGFNEIIINHAYLGEKLVDYLKDGSHLGAKITYSAEETALETAGGIRFASHLLGDEAFLVINGDIFTDFNFHEQLKYLKSSDYDGKTILEKLHDQEILAHLWLIPNPAHNSKGDFSFRPYKNLTYIGNQLEYTFSGIGVYHPALFSSIAIGEKAGLASVLRQAISNLKVTGDLFTGLWQDIGTPERLRWMEEYIAKNNLKSA